MFIPGDLLCLYLVAFLVYTWWPSLFIPGDPPCLYLVTLLVYTWWLSLFISGDSPCLYLVTLLVYTWWPSLFIPGDSLYIPGDLPYTYLVTFFVYTRWPSVACPGFILAGAEKNIRFGRKKFMLGRITRKQARGGWAERGRSILFQISGGGILRGGAYGPPVLKRGAYAPSAPRLRMPLVTFLVYTCWPSLFIPGDHPC